MAQLEAAKQKEVTAIRTNSMAEIDAARKATTAIEKELQAIRGKYQTSVALTQTLQSNLKAETRAKEEAQAQLNDLKGSLSVLSRQYQDKILALQEARQKTREAQGQGDISEIDALKEVVFTLEQEITLMQGQYAVAQERIKVLENSWQQPLRNAIRRENRTSERPPS